MLQTRLFPYFQGEGGVFCLQRRRRIFGWFGFAWWAAFWGRLPGSSSPIVGIQLPLYPAWWVLVGSLVGAAGVLAALTAEHLIQRPRTVLPTLGRHLLPRQTGGRFDALDALVVTAHQNLTASVMSGGLGVEFRLTLHWRGLAQPPLLLALDHRSVPGGAPLSVSAGPMLQLAHRVSNALGVRLYDNSAVLS